MSNSVFLLICIISITGCQRFYQAPKQNGASLEKQISQRAIYGVDNRTDYFQCTDRNHQLISKSVAAVMMDTSLEDLGNGFSRVRGELLSESARAVCRSARFSDQVVGAYGTASLIGEDLVLTAGHLVPNGVCPEAAIVFGFKKTSALSDATYLRNEDIYRCKSVEIYSYSKMHQDIAVMRLDRAVKGYKPIEIRFGELTRGQKIWMAGYPSGLPLKITDSAQVLATNRYFLRSELDAFGGNSGSPVLNEKGEIIGVLVRGEADYETQWSADEKRNCSVPTVIHLGEKSCEPNLFGSATDPWGDYETQPSRCYGEQVSRVSLIESELKNIQ